jgi:phage virion morphogenesis protein
VSGLSVTIDDAEVNRALRALAAHLDDLTPAMDAIGQALVTEVDLSFDGSRDPWGTPWDALSAVTLARRRGTSAQILRDTGHLANSINYHAAADRVEVGTDVIYAATHQFGRADNRMYNTPSGRPAPIPARPFLPIRPSGQVELPDATRDAILDLLHRHLAQALP